jgi:hypothetical protein
MKLARLGAVLVVVAACALVGTAFGAVPVVGDEIWESSFIAYIGSNAYQFSPALEGDLGTIELFTILSYGRAVKAGEFGTVAWRLEIRSLEPSGRIVRVVRGGSRIEREETTRAKFVWDGSDEEGNPVPEGHYSFTFRARFLGDRDAGLRRPAALRYEELEGRIGADVDEAFSSTGEIVVNYGLDASTSAELRDLLAQTSCQIQQNVPLESGFPYNFYYGSTHSHSNYTDGGQPTSTCASGAAYGSGTYAPAAVYDFAKVTAGLDYWVINEHNHLFDDAMSKNNPPVTEAKIRQRYQDGLAAANAATVNGTFVALFGVEFGVQTNSDQGHVTILESPKFMNWESCSTCTGATAECTPGTNCYFDVYVPKRYGYLKLYQASVQNPSSVGPLGILCHPESGNFDNFAFDANADAAMQGIAVRSGLAFSTATTCASGNVGSTDYFSRWTTALNKGFHVGPTVDHDSHCNNYGTALPNRTVYLVPNASSPALTKANLMAAHKARHFFATEDSNAQLVFGTSDSGKIMGDIFSTGSSVTLRAAVYDPNGESISTLELWRGQIGGGVLTTAYKSWSSASSFTQTESLASGTYYYFVRATQADGNKIWSSPVWITFGSAPTTYSIAGSVGTSGASVTAGSASATSDASGNYTLAGLAAGTYAVTPSKSGCTFSPTSLSVTVGPNAAGKSFTPTCGTTTYSIAGSVGTSGANVTAGSASVTSDASGNYTLAGLAAGTYAVTPSKSGCTFSPSSLSVTVGPNAAGKSFTATCGSGDTALTSGVALGGQSVAQGAWKYFSITVPSGATSLELKTTGATADLDIYTQFNAKPTSSSYTCRPYSSSGNETCTQANPSAGTWWLGVYGYAAATFTVTGTVVTGGGGTQTERLANGDFETITASGNAAPDGSWSRTAYTGTSFNTLVASGTYPHGGSDYALLGVNAATSSQTLESKSVTIPAAATSATFSFWVKITTSETGTTAYDKLQVQLVEGTTVLTTFVTLSNANAGAYVQKSYSTTAYKGKTVKVRFVGSTDSTQATTFYVDDVSLKSDG